MKNLIELIVKEHRLTGQLANTLGKSQEAVRKQIKRGNPTYDERMRINEALEKVTKRTFDPIELWSPAHKQKYHKYLNTYANS